MNVIDPILLRSLCYDIEADLPSTISSSDMIVENPNILILYSAVFRWNPEEHRRRLGILIGKKGRHLSELQTKFQIRINVITDTSSTSLRRNLMTTLRTFNPRHRYTASNIYVVMTELDGSNTTSSHIDEVKQLLRARWIAINNS